MRLFSKLSKRRPLAYALAVVIAIFMGEFSGYGPVAIYSGRRRRGVAAERPAVQTAHNEARGARRSPRRPRAASTPRRTWAPTARRRPSPRPMPVFDAGAAPRAALASLWRRVRDGVKRFAKRPRQSDSSKTTRSQGNCVRDGEAEHGSRLAQETRRRRTSLWPTRRCWKAMTSRRPARRRRRRPCHRSRHGRHVCAICVAITYCVTKANQLDQRMQIGGAPRRAVRAGGGPARRSRRRTPC